MKTITELAREADILTIDHHYLERFATIVRAAAIEECAELMDGYDYRRLSAEIRALKEQA